MPWIRPRPKSYRCASLRLSEGACFYQEDRDYELPVPDLGDLERRRGHERGLRRERRRQEQRPTGAESVPQRRDCPGRSVPLRSRLPNGGTGDRRFTWVAITFNVPSNYHRSLGKTVRVKRQWRRGRPGYVEPEPRTPTNKTHKQNVSRFLGTIRYHRPRNQEPQTLRTVARRDLRHPAGRFGIPGGSGPVCRGCSVADRGTERRVAGPRGGNKCPGCGKPTTVNKVQ
mgnify:CR=1 FL=1